MPRAGGRPRLLSYRKSLATAVSLTRAVIVAARGRADSADLAVVPGWPAAPADLVLTAHHMVHPPLAHWPPFA